MKNCIEFLTFRLIAEDDTPEFGAVDEAVFLKDLGTKLRNNFLITLLARQNHIASYLIGELGEVERRELADGLWAKTCDALVIIEPGTPAGYERILAARAQLIATGAHVVVPCPHDATCPLSAPDWCHFAQRLPRLRAHKQVKDAEVPFEDEKFSYAVLTRAPTSHHPARVLAPPHLSKVEVTAKLCTAGGLVHARIPRREKTAYAAARRWRWGNAVMEKG